MGRREWLSACAKRPFRHEWAWALGIHGCSHIGRFASHGPGPVRVRTATTLHSRTTAAAAAAGYSPARRGRRLDHHSGTGRALVPSSSPTLTNLPPSSLARRGSGFPPRSRRVPWPCPCARLRQRDGAGIRIFFSSPRTVYLSPRARTFCRYHLSPPSCPLAMHARCSTISNGAGKTVAVYLGLL
jgi:hypothetical protein